MAVAHVMPWIDVNGLHREPRQPSLRRRLLAYLLIPTLVLMIADTMFVYMIALKYSNRVHDRDLVYSTLGLADAIEDGRSDGHLTDESRALLDYSPNGKTFYSIRSARHGVVGGSARHLFAGAAPAAGQPPILYDAWIAGLPVRAASVSILSPTEQGDSLVVSMAESLHDRQFIAREILLITIPIESLLVLALFVLVWRGVASGLRILDAPIERLAARERTLEPLSGPDIPIEILPFTRAIDGLFERIQALVVVQERFVADAAHQLRTPLAGLAMQVERVCASESTVEIRAAMQHIRRLTNRMSRSATQLLSLARAQAPKEWTALFSRVDLAKWLPEVVAARVPEALENGIDLGYEGGAGAAEIDAEPGALQELFDNLIDNALHHAPRGGTVTVSLLPPTEKDDGVQVRVEDDGPGVPDDLIGRLGERFFRTPASRGNGSGLGLAIVLRIAQVHGARVLFRRSRLGGLLVDIRFPGAGVSAA